MKKKDRVFPGIALGLLVIVAGTGFAAPSLTDAIWSSRLAVKDGVSDFDNRTFGELFRDAKFQQVVTPQGVKVTFELDPKSVGGSEAVIDFVMKKDGVEAERFTFSFHCLGAYTVLYKLSSDRGTIVGSDELLKAMRRFYLPCLEQ